MTLEQDQTRATNPGTSPAGWDSDADLDDAMLADEDVAQQFVVPSNTNSWDASQDDDGSSFTNIWRQLSWMLVPIPFAIIIFLFSMLAASRGIANLAPLPLGIILLTLVVIQGTLLYYAGNNDTMWTLSIIGGYLLFLLVGAFVFFSFNDALILLVIILALGIIFGRHIIRLVPEGQVDIILMFGRYHRTLLPGLNLLFPWETFYTHARTKETTWATPPMRLTTSRDQDVELVASVTYQLQPEDAYIAVMQIADWETDLHQHFQAVLKSYVSELSPDDFVAWTHHVHSRPHIIDELANPMAETRWDRLNAAVMRRLQDQVATRGIKINMVHILDITVISRDSSSITPIRSIPVDTGMMRGLSPQPQSGNVPQLLSAQQAAIAAQPTAQPMPMVLPAPPPAATLNLTPATIQFMKDAFDSIRDNRITDLTIINKLLRDFEQIATTPELDAQFPYDAKKAVNALRNRITDIKVAQAVAQAQRASIPASPIPTPVELPAQPVRPARRLPSLPNDNLAGGG